MSVRAIPKRWSIAPPPAERDLAMFGAVPKIVATLLHVRGITAAEAPTFLSQGAQPLPDPMRLPGMWDAIARLRYAHEHVEKVCIYGDYDADGLTAQALLVTALRAWGFADVLIYTPHREREGYGLHSEALAEIAAQGVGLVIAVDCGISNAREVAEIGERGVDVIIVDHHAVPIGIPAATAVINPHLAESTYPFRDLAGVGVAYALVRALAASGAPFARPERGVLETLLAFLAIGTVADVVPLRGENRILVRAGLRALRTTHHAGLCALCERAGIRQSELDAGHISFALAPRLNAPGRVHGVEDAYRLLMPESDVDARMAALALDEANRTRQMETQRAVAEAVEMVDAGAVPGADRLIFIGDPSWSVGIVGLVAAKLVERYHRPAFVYAQGDSVSRGSARSIAAFNVIEALENHADLMMHYGGHPRAAGFTVSNAMIADLRDALLECAGTLTEDDIAPELHVDAVIDHSDITLSTYAEVSALAPFGHGNAEPVFLVPHVRVRETRRVGADGAHLSFYALLDTGAGIRCIAFGAGPRERELANLGIVDLAVTLQRDVWRGDERLQLRVRDFRPTH